MKIPVLLVGIAALAVAGPAAAQSADVAALAASCAACHGANGGGSGGIARLRGQQQTYLAEQLKAFKTGTRQGTVMNRFAKGYTDDEIAALALHFSRLK